MVSEALRGLARCLYRQLQSEHDQLSSDETIEDGIIANEYTFIAGGGGSDDTWEGSTYVLQNIQNVCIFCTNGDPDHA